MSTAIIAIGSATPEFKISQSDMADVLFNQVAADFEYTEKIQLLFNKSGIANRNGVIPLSDVNEHYKGKKTLLNKNKDRQAPSISERIDYQACRRWDRPIIPASGPALEWK